MPVGHDSLDPVPGEGMGVVLFGVEGLEAKSVVAVEPRKLSRLAEFVGADIVARAGRPGISIAIGAGSIFRRAVIDAG